jgi:hypothetical protein
MEVDSMIEMLTRFRKECGEYIGVWRRWQKKNKKT